MLEDEISPLSALSSCRHTSSVIADSPLAKEINFSPLNCFRSWYFITTTEESGILPTVLLLGSSGAVSLPFLVSSLNLHIPRIDPRSQPLDLIDQENTPCGAGEMDQ